MIEDSRAGRKATSVGIVVLRHGDQVLVRQRPDDPLLAMLGAASIRSRIATGPESGEPWRRLGDRVEPVGEEQNRVEAIQSAQYLSEQVNHIIEIVRVQQEHARGGEVLENISPSEVVEAALLMCSSAIEAAGVELVCQHEATDQVNVDRHKILQILVNLINNACQALAEFDQPKPTLVTRVSVSTERLTFEIEDNGPGIDPNHLKKIFYHGFTTKDEGHGFGLHSSANAASQMRGKLHVTNCGDDRGARFTLTIPIPRITN